MPAIGCERKATRAALHQGKSKLKLQIGQCANRGSRNNIHTEAAFGDPAGIDDPDEVEHPSMSVHLVWLSIIFGHAWAFKRASLKRIGWLERDGRLGLRSTERPRKCLDPRAGGLLRPAAVFQSDLEVPRFDAGSAF